MRKCVHYLVLLSFCLSASLAHSQNSKKKEEIQVLVPTSTFLPFVGDPRWPRFTLAYLNYLKGGHGHHIFAPTAGAVLPIVRRHYQKSEEEWGFQAAIFSIMDVGSRPTRMLNSDFFVGPYVTVQRDKWGFLFRISHTSSHLGDEFLLSSEGKNVERVNLSYEAFEATAAYRLDNGIRPYLGLTYLVDTDPPAYRTFELIGGFDFYSRKNFLNGYGKPLFGIHSKMSKNSNWTPSLSFKGGLEIEDKIIIGKTLQLLLEYFYGHSIHGQFYKEVESYAGLSFNINF